MTLHPVYTQWELQTHPMYFSPSSWHRYILPSFTCQSFKPNPRQRCADSAHAPINSLAIALLLNQMETTRVGFFFPNLQATYLFLAPHPVPVLGQGWRLEGGLKGKVLSFGLSAISHQGAMAEGRWVGAPR